MFRSEAKWAACGEWRGRGTEGSGGFWRTLHGSREVDQKKGCRIFSPCSGNRRNVFRAAARLGAAVRSLVKTEQKMFVS